MNTFKEKLLSKNKFTVTWEQVPGKIKHYQGVKDIIDNTRQAVDRHLVDVISITDGAGGNPALPAEYVAIEFKKAGIEPLVHIALRDKNSAQIQSQLYNLAVNDISNILVISGDYPGRDTLTGRAAPVFDLDPVHVANMARDFYISSDAQSQPSAINDTVGFFVGVGVSPFKRYEPEVIGQYYKLEKKIKAGAGFVISQIGYDARKMHELVQWFKYMEYQVPVLANIYVLSYAMAKAIHQNRLPGVVVTDDLLLRLQAEKSAGNAGKKDRYERAARMYAIAKGMGYAGVHVGGFKLGYQELETIISRGEELSPQWMSLIEEFNFSQQAGYFLFEKEQSTGLNRMEETGLTGKGRAPIGYWLSRLFYGAFFDPAHPFFKFYQKFAAWVDRSNLRRRIYTRITHLIKVLLYNCQDCGDCALHDIAYICPVAECPKERRVGPCGGSVDGWCEVYPGQRKCIWVLAYERLQAFDEENSLTAYTVPPRDWELWRTSSHLNYYLGRDHTAKRLGIKAP